MDAREVIEKTICELQVIGDKLAELSSLKFIIHEKDTPEMYLGLVHNIELDATTMMNLVNELNKAINPIVDKYVKIEKDKLREILSVFDI